MLFRSFIGRPLGNYDRILDFSTAVTGGLLFIPTATFLDSISSDQPAQVASSGAEKLAMALTRVETSASSAPSKNGSLGIGSLKRENSHE